MCRFDDMNCHLTSFDDIKRKKLGPQKSLFYLRGPQKGPRKKGFLGLFGDVAPPPLYRVISPFHETERLAEAGYDDYCRITATI